MRESRTYGSVRGARGNSRPYCERYCFAAVHDDMRLSGRNSVYDPGCVKTLRGITAPGILGPVVMRRAKNRKNLSSARHYDQISFRFRTAKTQRRHSA